MSTPGILPSTVRMVPVDFTEDGTDEYFVSFERQLTEPGTFDGQSTTRNGEYVVYGYTEGEWYPLYEDAGLVDADANGHALLDVDQYLSVLDLNGDGKEEAVITKYTEGAYYAPSSYALTWENGAIIAAPFVSTKTTAQLKNDFLDSGETFCDASLWAMDICKSGDRAEIPEPVARVIHDFKYEGGSFVEENYLKIIL